VHATPRAARAGARHVPAGLRGWFHHKISLALAGHPAAPRAPPDLKLVGEIHINPGDVTKRTSYSARGYGAAGDLRKPPIIMEIIKTLQRVMAFSDFERRC